MYVTTWLPLKGWLEEQKDHLTKRRKIHVFFDKYNHYDTDI